MLPHATNRFLRAARATLIGVALLASACGPEQSPEARVRAVVEAGEAAAEARDLSGLMALVSRSYRDERGNGPEELKQYLRGYLVMHQSVHLLTRVESVEFPYRDYAKVRLTVGTLGRETAAATAFDVAADVNEIVLELALEDDEWRVMRAAWQSARRG
ncbi:MAG: hypothetical protein WBO04_15395 [Steroidobacteraceae bacterium]